MTTIEEIYEAAVKHLPAADRLRLAGLILNDIPPQSLVDYSDNWSDEDLNDFQRSSWVQVDAILGDEADA